LDEILRQVGRMEPDALATVKRLVLDCAIQDDRAVMDAASTELVRLLRRPEARAGMEAFLQKKPPPWAADYDSAGCCCLRAGSSAITRARSSSLICPQLTISPSVRAQPRQKRFSASMTQTLVQGLIKAFFSPGSLVRRAKRSPS